MELDSIFNFELCHRFLNLEKCVRTRLGFLNQNNRVTTHTQRTTKFVLKIKIKTIGSLKKEEPPNKIDSYIIPEDWEGCFVHKNTNFQYHKIDTMPPNLAGWCMMSCLTRCPSK